MRKLKQRVLAFLVTLVMVIQCCSIQTEAAGELPIVDETIVRARVLELAQKLGINITSLDQNGDGVYFTANGTYCQVGSHGSCNNCHNTEVIKADWFKNTFGTISSEGIFPSHYSAYQTGGTISNNAYSCAGFVSFALWYIAKADNTSDVYRKYLGNTQIQSFSIENLKSSDIRIGDVIRINVAGTDSKPHSMMFISMDENAGTIKVLDCNWRGTSNTSSQVKIHDITMSSYSGYNMAITRAKNYEPGEKMPADNVTTAESYKQAIGTKAKTYGEFTRESFLNLGFSDIPDAWCVWFIRHCANQVGAGRIFSTSNLTTTFYEEMTNPNGPYKATGVYFNEGNITDFNCFKYAIQVDRSTYVPQAGDIICLNWNGEGATSIGHMGVVTGYNASTKKIAFVDGNVRSTNTENLRVKVRDGNSYELFSLTNSQIVGYIRPNYDLLLIPEDNVSPVISDIKVTTDSLGYTISCVATDNEQITAVKFPTWTEYNWQDDIAPSYPDGTYNNGRWEYRVNISEHNGETGLYHTHIYAYDSAGNYSLAATTAYIEGGPKIVEQPESQSATLNNTDTFSVIAEGNGLSYQWQYANAGSSEWSNCYLSGYNTNTLSVKAISYRNGMQFRCVVTDNEGNEIISEAATLTIAATPVSITSQPTSQSVALNENANFTVGAGGSDLTYQWQYANAESSEWANCYLSGYNTSTLTVKASSYRNGMQFRCVVKNAAGEAVTSNSAKLSIVASTVTPEISTQPIDQRVALDEAATFSVVTNANDLNYQWQYANAGSDEWSNCYLSGYNTSTLSVKATSYRVGMKFRCVVSNASGASVTSDAAELCLESNLMLISQPTDKAVALDETTNFTVGASGSGLTYQWQYAGAGSNEWSNCYLSGYNTSTLSVKATSYRIGMKFRCIVKDGSGASVTSEEAVMTLKTSSGDIQITTQPVSKSASIDSSVSFTVGASGSNLSYQWQYANAGSSEWANCYLSGYNTSTLTVKATSYRDGMQFRCVVSSGSNSAVSNSNSASVTISK